jgi:hypothetical protein
MGTNVTRAASLNRAQLFLFVFQSRKVGPGFPVIAPDIAGVRGAISLAVLLASTVEGNQEVATLSINLEES